MSVHYAKASASNMLMSPLYSRIRMSGETQVRVYDKFVKTTVEDAADYMANGYHPPDHIRYAVSSVKLSVGTAYMLLTSSNVMETLQGRFRSRTTVSSPVSDFVLMEEPALQLYTNRTGYQVFRSGPMVNPKVPWLVGQADGLICDGFGGAISRGVEVKHFNIRDMKNLPFYNNEHVHCVDGAVRVRKDTNTYFQMQLYMAISNVALWDLILYQSEKKEIYVYTVRYDADFINQQLSKLHYIYQNAVFPYLCNVIMRRNILNK
jgi:hypothetical protein